MRRAIYAALVACVFTFVPIFVLRLDSETKFVDSLKWVAATFGVPGAFVGLLAAFMTSTLGLQAQLTLSSISSLRG
jgi:hypothetical protein